VFRFEVNEAYNRIFALYDSDGQNSVVLARNNIHNGLWFDIKEGTLQHVVKTPINPIFQAQMSSFVHVVVTYVASVSSNTACIIYVNGASQTPLTQVNTPDQDPMGFSSKTREKASVWRDHYADTGKETTKFIKFYNQVLSATEVSLNYSRAQKLL
jgi:hypothetical protein